MSIKIMSWVWDQDIRPASHKLILIALADWADDDGFCFPSRRKIAHKTGASVDTVDRAIAIFEQSGLIVKSERQRPDGSTSSSLYQIVPEGAAKCGRGGRTHAEGGAAPMPPLNKEPSNEPPIKNSHPPKGGDDGFEEFWKEYPHRKNRPSKAKIRPKYRKTAAKIGADKLIAAAKAYKADLKAEGKLEFAKGVEPWLNGEFWESWIPQAKAAAEPEAGWDAALQVFMEKSLWAEHWGPPPGAEDCIVPASILREHGFDGGRLV